MKNKLFRSFALIIVIVSVMAGENDCRFTGKG